MKGIIEYDYDTEEGECFDLEIGYDYIPYSSAYLTADSYDSEPPDGGYCEDVIYKVVGYRQYDDDLNTTLDLEVGTLTLEQTKELTAKFINVLEGNLNLEEHLHNICVEDAES